MQLKFIHLQNNYAYPKHANTTNKFIYNRLNKIENAMKRFNPVKNK